MGTKNVNNESVKTTSVEVNNKAKAAKAPKAANAAKKESAAKAEKPKVEKPKAAAKAPKAAEKAAKVAAEKPKVSAPKVAAKTPKAAEKAAKVAAPKVAKVAKADAPKQRGRQAEGVFKEEIDYIIAKIRRAAADSRMSRKDQDEYDAAKAKGLRVQPRYSCYHSAALLTSTLEYIKSIGIEYERDCNGKGHRFRFFVPKKGTKAYKTVIG